MNSNRSEIMRALCYVVLLLAVSVILALPTRPDDYEDARSQRVKRLMGWGMGMYPWGMRGMMGGFGYPGFGMGGFGYPGFGMGGFGYPGYMGMYG
ncbi:hypothetical protein GCK32_002514 [Trichostrongylus colubriformis]|uniref:Uncharacterized protein n=1 Tax=Trichostrongylus colubriformis TaxID=6319 RepID=A0AAN8F6A1_TRICO